LETRTRQVPLLKPLADAPLDHVALQSPAQRLELDVEPTARLRHHRARFTQRSDRDIDLVVGDQHLSGLFAVDEHLRALECH
jgi:hypothetical protein